MKDRKRLIIVFVLFAIALGVMAGIYLFNKKNGPSNIPKRSSAELSSREKSILGIEEDEDTQKENEIEEKSKSDLYKEYEKKTTDEKKESDVIPRKKKVPYKVIDDIKKDEEKEKKDKDKGGLPKKFNLADKIKIKVEDQGMYGLCWDFASITSLETFLSLKENKNYDFSEMHLNYIESNLMYGDRQLDDGGNFDFFKKYLTVSGVVNEKQVPYVDYKEDEYNKFASMNRVINVTKTVEFPDFTKFEENYYTEKELKKFRDTVKTHIMNNGSLYAQVIGPNDVNSYYDVTESGMINHAVSIVGWDDNYSKEKFTSPNGKKPKENGAYIVLNSWGESFGENGYYYVSYEDKYIESALSGISSVALKDANRIDNMTNTVLKDYIEDKYEAYIIESNGKKYLPTFVTENFGFLDLSGIGLTSVDGIEILGNPYGIDLSDNNINDVSSLKTIKNLGYLSLKNNKNVSGFEKLTEIGELDLTGCNIKDASVVSDFNNLYDLVLNNNPGIKNLDKISKSVVHLSVENCEIDSLKEISSLKDLNSLDLKNNNITKISELKGLDELIELNISQNSISDLENLKELTIGTLIAAECGVEDASIFNDLNLGQLDLSNNNIKDLSNFEAKGIYSINLSGNKDITGLEKIKDVSDVVLKDCNISDLTEVAKLENVESLDLSNNNIKDISDIESLKNLYMLSLSGNKGIYGSFNKGIDIINLSNCELDDSFDFSIFSSATDINLGDNDIKDISKIFDMHTSPVFIYADNIEVDEKELEEINESIESKEEEWFYSSSISGLMVKYGVDAISADQKLDLNSHKLIQKIARNGLNNMLLDVKNGIYDRSLDWIKVKNIDSDVRINIIDRFGKISGLKIRINIEKILEEDKDSDNDNEDGEEQNTTNTEENEIKPDENTVQENEVIEENTINENEVVENAVIETKETENNN